jgi:hypothetical protein
MEQLGHLPAQGHSAADADVGEGQRRAIHAGLPAALHRDFTHRRQAPAHSQALLPATR